MPTVDQQWREADTAHHTALSEFTAASAVVIARIKAGERLPKSELDREWNARIHLIETRDSVARLDRLRKQLAAAATASGPRI
jgi:hypothetical protein